MKKITILVCFVLFYYGCTSPQIVLDKKLSNGLDSVLHKTENFCISYSKMEDKIFLTDFRTKKSYPLISVYNPKYGVLPSDFYIQQDNKNSSYFFMTNYELIHGYYSIDIFLYVMKNSKLLPIKISYKSLNSKNFLNFNAENIKLFKYQGQFFYRKKELLFHLKTEVVTKTNHKYYFNNIFINKNNTMKKIEIVPLIP